MNTQPEVKVCPKCGGIMEKGWMRGRQEVRWVTRVFGSSKKIHAFACQQCGYLESYVDTKELGFLGKLFSR